MKGGVKKEKQDTRRRQRGKKPGKEGVYKRGREQEGEGGE